MSLALLVVTEAVHELPNTALQVPDPSIAIGSIV